VTLGLCTQIDLDLEVERASKNRAALGDAEHGSVLVSARETEVEMPVEDEGEKEIDADAVFAKLSSMKRTEPEDEDDS